MGNELNLEQFYISYKPLLFSLAYRMLGSVMDAEDIVQEAFVFLNEASTEHIRNMKAYLCKMVTNRCIDLIRSASKQREVYVGPWLPEPLITEEYTSNEPSQSYIMKESIATAFLLLLQQLTSVERAVFLLREVLQFEYEQIAEVVDKSGANCRQIFHRAKRSMGSLPNYSAENSNTRSKPEPSTLLIEQFVQALAIGDINGLMNALSLDAVLYTDGGGKVISALRPIIGADRISRFFIGILEKAPNGFSYQFTTVNGQLGLVCYENKQAINVISFQLEQDHITAVYIVTNPDKLKHIK